MIADLVVPALTLRDAHGAVDSRATAEYASRAAATWADRFLLSGSTTRGWEGTTGDRAAVVDLWLDLAPTSRLVACCWSDADIAVATDREVTPMVVLRDLPDAAAVVLRLADLPREAYVYSHPALSSAVLGPDTCAYSRASGHLPAGAKMAKVDAAAIGAVRSSAGPDFVLWDGSSRAIARSVAAGADGVVAIPFSSFDAPFPSRDPTDVQRALDRAQADLDRLGSRRERSDYLHARALTRSSRSGPAFR